MSKGERETLYFDGLPESAMRRAAEWYGLGFFGTVAFAMARCNSTEVRYDWGPASGDGIRFGDPRYTWQFGPFIPAGASDAR